MCATPKGLTAALLGGRGGSAAVRVDALDNITPKMVYAAVETATGRDLTGQRPLMKLILTRVLEEVMAAQAAAAAPPPSSAANGDGGDDDDDFSEPDDMDDDTQSRKGRRPAPAPKKAAPAPVANAPVKVCSRTRLYANARGRCRACSLCAVGLCCSSRRTRTWRGGCRRKRRKLGTARPAAPPRTRPNAPRRSSPSRSTARPPATGRPRAPARSAPALASPP